MYVGIFLPFTWEQGVVIDNAIGTINQSNTHQRTGSVRSSEIAANSNAVGDGSSKNSFGAGTTLMVSSDHPHSSPTPPLQRRLAKSFSVAPSHSQSKGFYPHTLFYSHTLFLKPFFYCTLFEQQNIFILS